MIAIRNTIIFGLLTAAIIVFWLVPGMNNAKDNTYVRRYEDTDRKANSSRASKSGKLIIRADSLPGKENKKTGSKYKEQRIRSNAKIEDLQLSMFARSIQFTEEKELYIDSLYQIEVAAADSVQDVRRERKTAQKMKGVVKDTRQ